jgi:hypothetical protein
LRSCDATKGLGDGLKNDHQAPATITSTRPSASHFFIVKVS